MNPKADFQFKQFSIRHDQCAMKVGTDGVLLGAWATLASAQRILDLGTGSGLIALMLAQRYPNAQISAIELDRQAAMQAQQNALATPWSQRIHIEQQDALDFLQQSQQPFDLIVSNPPYFKQGIHCATAQRNQARYVTQSHLSWLQTSAQALSPQGKICFILPFDAGIALKQISPIPCVEYCEVISKIGKSPNRLLLSFAHQKQAIQKTQLIIFDEQNQYHQDFVQLTKAFYLKF